MAAAPPGAAARSAALNVKYGLGKSAKAVAVKAVKAPAAKVAVAKPLTMAEQAAQIADLSINPARTDLTTSISQAEAQRVAGATATAKITEALAHMSAGDAAAARDAYAQAGDAIAGYAKGFTGSLRSGQEAAAAADNARISGLGSPGGPVVEHAGQNADVSYLLGGQMPAESLAKRAASALVTTQDKRYAGGAAIADTGLANDFKTEQGIASLRTQLLGLEAKRPGLIQQALASLAQQENQRRATQVQIGTLQLQGAKTLGDQAVAYTNLTGTVHVVRGNKVVDTGVPASGSDAAKVAQQGSIAAANNVTKTAIAKAQQQTQREIAQTAADAKVTAAQTAAEARVTAARTAAEAKATAVKVAAQNKQGKPATAAQRATILKNAGAQGNSLVVTTRDRIWALIPESAPQGKTEDAKTFAARHAQALTIYKARLKEHRAEIVSRVAALISPQLKLIGYRPADIQAQADAIVSAQIPG